MKRILNYSALVMLTIVLLTSCGTHKSFADRHYNNRYYIGMSKGEKAKKIKTDNPDKDAVVDEEEFGLTVNPEIENTVVVDSSSNIDMITEEANQETTEETITREKSAPAELFGKRNPKNQETPFALIEKAEQVKEKISPSDSSDDALSLLWIVIVVILILWLLGYALGGLGMGGAIHILLVIALILLVLWLLGII